MAELCETQLLFLPGFVIKVKLCSFRRQSLDAVMVTHGFVGLEIYPFVYKTDEGSAFYIYIYIHIYMFVCIYT